VDCQQQSGSAFGMSLVAEEENFHLIQGALKTITSKSAAGRPKSGLFCPQCGTRIYHKTESRKGMVSLKPGTLDDTKMLAPDIHIWTASKQPWVTIPEGVEVHEKNPG